MCLYLENTWVSSCSVQFGPRLATKSVGHGIVEELFCQCKKIDSSVVQNKCSCADHIPLFEVKVIIQ